MQKINLVEKLGKFSEHWSPKIIAELNGQHVKLVKSLGAFPWHHHEHEDELFFVVRGWFRAASNSGRWRRKRCACCCSSPPQP